jgi:hypothetical protein
MGMTMNRLPLPTGQVCPDSKQRGPNRLITKSGFEAQVNGKIPKKKTEETPLPILTNFESILSL